ncbi:MAG: hypothetical protein RLO54_15745 [Sandaracinaceae bacterium]
MMIRRTLLVSLFASLLLVACGGDHGLTARGSVTADADGRSTGFAFPDDTRLDVAGDGAAGLVTGECEMAKVGEDAWGLVVTIRRGATVDDLGLSSVTIMQRTDADPSAGRVEAELGTTLYSPAAGATCQVDVPYAVDDGGMVGLTGDCAVQDVDGNTATVSVELDLVGCTVID